ncbi:Rrf2 family transcriptional regulator [Candidatus Sumerlaeota bacterium]|nr:Rrf2 family transcriptional regulator [Candidatus Sumerlaeota bacterium]
MRISTKGRYGVRLMLDLAVNYNGRPVLLREVAKRQKISEKYLSQLIIPLKTAGLISSSRGAHGGYLLAKDPRNISLKEIVESLEGPLSIVECVTTPSVCSQSGTCVARDVWTATMKQIAGFLSSMTLDKLAKMEKKKQGIARKRKGK